MVSPKWQTMWIESQHCSKSIVNVTLPSQQAKKILEDLKTSCCSPNKAVQVEALKCWGLWINNQNPDDWKQNTVCFTAMRPLISKKLQPLHKDVDICKLKLSLMWALLLKVQEILHLEGPQYILEAFLQSCLNWLSSNGDDSDSELFVLIFQWIPIFIEILESVAGEYKLSKSELLIANLVAEVLLAVFNKNESFIGCDKEMFPPLSSDVLHLKKVFHQLADKFLNIFIYWRRIKDKSVILKMWKHFLEHCELSYDHIPIPLWHKVFKLTSQICSEKDEPVKDRLAFLHSCATTLKSALSSSKFIDFGNLLTTPCEVLLKKLVELCTVDCHESCDSEMFLHSKEICQVLSGKSVAISGYDLCIGVLDALEEFCLRSLFWGVWCGLVYCYKTLLKDIRGNQLTKTEMKFYRKLRGVAVNFELDKGYLHEDCIQEVEKHIGYLSIGCLCSSRTVERTNMSRWCDQPAESSVELLQMEKSVGFSVPQCGFDRVSNTIVPVVPRCAQGQFSLEVLHGRKNLVSRKTLKLNFDLIRDILNTVTINFTKSLLNSRLTFRFITMQTAVHDKAITLPVSVGVRRKNESSHIVPCPAEKTFSHRSPCTPVKKNASVAFEVNHKAESDEEAISTPTTRSKKRAEEERKKVLEMQKRRKRKSFEVLVQEIVRKNKERKTEKNSKRKKTQDTLKGKRGRKKVERGSDKKDQKVSNVREKRSKQPEVSDRRLRNSKKEEHPKNLKKKEKKSLKTDGKLENYFKVINKKSGNETKKEVKKTVKGKENKKSRESSCCNLTKDEGERWRQTSLKTMMNTKSKAEKLRQGMRTREKNINLIEMKPKVRGDERKLLGSPLARSPFKEVLHDHEYAKMEPGEKETQEKIVHKTEKKTRVKPKKKPEGTNLSKMSKSKSELLLLEKVDCLETKASPERERSILEKPESENDKTANVPTLTSSIAKSLEESELKETEIPRFPAPEEPQIQKKEAEGIVFKVMDPASATTICCDEEGPKKPGSELVEENFEVESIKTEIIPIRKEFSENESTPDKRGNKRIRMLDTLKPIKKIKLEKATEELMDEKLPLEVTEKENFEEKQLDVISPPEKEKIECLIPRNNGSPKAVGSGMSRALRIIGLVPESTMARSWESSPRMEAFRCKKAPNVDKNSRASKMLALLSENVVEAEEAVKMNQEEIHSSLAISTTPNAKTPLSSLKSPKSIKKRRSIRFDDARNETVLYQIDLPPSQILEEKEKRRGTKPFEIVLPLP